MLRLTTEPFVFMYTLVYSIHMTVLPQLVFKKSCDSLYNTTICNSIHEQNEFKMEGDTVKEQTSLWMLIIVLATLLPSLFTILIWGPIADIIGRKRAITVPPIFLGIQSGIYLLNCTIFMSSPIPYLILGAFVTSLYGDFQGAFALAYSHMADVTEKNPKRTMRMAVLEGIMFISGAPAGLISGYILQQLGYAYVFVTTLCLSFVILLYVIFFLPSTKMENPSLTENTNDTSNETSARISKVSETSTDGEETPIICEIKKLPAPSTRTVSLNPFHHFRTVFLVIFKRKSRALLIALLTSFCLSLVAVTGELYITVLYTKTRPFNLSPEQIGYYMAFMSLTRGIGAIILPQIAVRCFKINDFVLICFGLLSQTCNYLLVAFATSKVMLYLVTLSGIGIGVATSGIRALITKQVPDNSHGSVLAAIEFMDGFGGLLGNVISNGVYNGTVSTFPGMAFIILAAFSVASLGITLGIRCCSKKPV